MDPRNNNPFATRERREPRNEREAHDALLKTVREIGALNRMALDILAVESKPRLRVVK